MAPHCITGVILSTEVFYCVFSFFEKLHAHHFRRAVNAKSRFLSTDGISLVIFTLYFVLQANSSFIRLIMQNIAL